MGTSSKKVRILELFGGIGACSKALERLGVNYEIADYVEIDKYAVKSFNAMHGTSFETQDITEWDKDIDVDLIMHGSPCQDFSVAGRGAGGDEGSGTRSSLMYETIRIVEKLKPKYVIWENVKNLLSKKHRHNFDAYQETMKNLGYTNYYQVLNAKDYGIPQNRERVFTVSIRNDVHKGFVFPEPIPLEKKLKDMLEDEVDENYFISDNNLKTDLCNKLVKDGIVKGGEIVNHSYTTSEQRNTLDKYIESKNGVMPTLTTRPDCLGYATMPPDVRIRKLTPKECWRLMGFDDSDIDKAQQAGLSNAQLYKQAGNSIVVNVLETILRRINFE